MKPKWSTMGGPMPRLFLYITDSVDTDSWILIYGKIFDSKIVLEESTYILLRAIKELKYEP